MESFLSRKFIFAILSTLLGFVLVLAGKVDANDFLRFIEVVGGSYILGNLGDTVTDKFADKVEPPSMEG